MLVAVFYVVFGIFLNRGSGDFVAFLITGQIPFVWISRSISNSSSSILVGKNLITQIRITPIFFPVVVIFQDLFKICFVYILMLLVLMVLGYSPSIYWAFLPVIMLIQFVYIAGFSILVAAVVPFVPDVRFIIETLLMMLMFASGIFYKIEDVLLEEHRDLFLLNPFAKTIDYHRELLLHHNIPDLNDMTLSFGVGIVFLGFSLFFINALKSAYPKVVV